MCRPGRTTGTTQSDEHETGSIYYSLSRSSFTHLLTSTFRSWKTGVRNGSSSLNALMKRYKCSLPGKPKPPRRRQALCLPPPHTHLPRAALVLEVTLTYPAARYLSGSKKIASDISGFGNDGGFKRNPKRRPTIIPRIIPIPTPLPRLQQARDRVQFQDPQAIPPMHSLSFSR